MSRDLLDEDYYVSHGGIIPVKWTAPEVYILTNDSAVLKSLFITQWYCTTVRLFTTRSTPLPVMCGALDVSCMRYGVLDTNHLKPTIILRYNMIWSCYKPSSHAQQTLILGDQNDRQGLSPPSPSWTIKGALQDHDSVLVYANISSYTIVLKWR